MRNAIQRLTAALRLRQFELICMLADTGNMRAAGQRLNISTAAVSKGLQDIESLFGVALFHRLSRGVVATAAGTLVVQRARVILGELAHLSDELTMRDPSASDTIKIGAPPFIAWTLVPKILARMIGEGHTSRVQIVEGRLADIGRQLEAGDIDVLITMNSPSELGGLKPDGFVIEQIWLENWIVVCAPGHSMAPRGERPAPKKWKDLVAEKWILPPRPTNSRMMVEQVLLKSGLTPVIPYIETMNAITHLQLAERSLGITVAAKSVVEDRLERGTLVQVLVQDLLPLVPIVLVYRLRAAYKGSLAALCAAAQRLRSEAASVESRDSASNRKLSPRKSRP